jgi:heat shock protein HslJ
MAVAVVLAAVALAGCGGEGKSEEEKRASRAKARALAMGLDAAEAKIFAQDSRYCSMQPRADLALEFGLSPDATPRAIARWHAEGAHSRIRKVVFEGCLDGLSKTPARAPPSSPLAQVLWGREFVATSVGRLPRKPSPPVRHPSHIRISFSNKRDHVVGWSVGCNDAGGKVRATATKLLVSNTGSTLVGCFGEVGEEEDWLGRFMESDPEWRLDGNELTLIANGATIELMGLRDPVGCPISPSGGRIDFEADVHLVCEAALNLLTNYAEGRERYLNGWKCRRETQADGLDRLRCRFKGKSQFTARDFDLESLRAERP